jgi:hypothetical protein
MRQASNNLVMPEPDGDSILQVIKVIGAIDARGLCLTGTATHFYVAPLALRSCLRQ